MNTEKIEVNVNTNTGHTMFYLSVWIIGGNCLGPYTLHFPCIYKKGMYYEVVELRAFLLFRGKEKQLNDEERINIFYG